MKRMAIGAVLLGLVVLLLGGCAAPAPSEDIEAIREAIADLKERVTTLEGKVTALEETAIRVIHAEPWVKVSDDPNLLIESPAFDRDGNLYVAGVDTGEIFKITPDKKVSKFFKDEDITHMSSIDIHKDGRLFCCTFTQGTIITVAPDGNSYETIIKEMKGPDDLVFNSEGDFYVSDLFANKIWYVSSDLKTVKVIKPLLGLTPTWPNGISLVDSPISGKERRLLINEYKGTVWRLDLDAEEPWKESSTAIAGRMPLTYVAGSADSNAVDADGNLYQCINGRGIVILKGNTGEIIGEVQFPGVEAGEQVGVTNMTIKPGTNEAYAAVSLGPRGAEIYKFSALAEAPTYFSHQPRD